MRHNNSKTMTFTTRYTQNHDTVHHECSII